MRKIAVLMASLALGAALGAPAIAQQDRYALEKSGDGYVRMDKRTGEMSICKESGGQLVCRMAADDRRAFEDEVDLLRGRVERLEERLTALEKAPAVPDAALPSESEFERTLGYMERFFRRFMDIVKDFERDFSGEKEPEPQRT